MNNGKFENRNAKSGKKAVAILLVLVLLLGAVVGTTLAWLLDKTDSVVNTFTVGNININLTENDKADTAQNFPVIPGSEVTKKAVVEVEADSEACWLFVKVEEAGDATDNWIQWSVNSAWTAVDGVDNVYYIEVNETTADTGATYEVLTDNKVTISGDMTKQYVDGLTDMPTLTFTAYAIQSELLNDGGADPMTAARAWTLLESKLP